MKKTVVFQDEAGSRLEVVIDRLPSGRWETYLRHSSEGRGATRLHASERVAIAVWHGLELEVMKRGWKLRTVETKDTSPPAEMKTSTAGRRLFRDRRTGEYFEDLSSERPPQVTLAAPRKYVDAFDVLSLPRPRRAL